MKTSRKKNFSWRAFVSLYVTWSFLILFISGIILYIAPAGRIAKWTHIGILGLEKAQWQALHTIFAFLFIIAAAFHLYFNWKPFVFYLKDKIKQGLTLRKEVYSSTVLVLAIFILTLWNVPPFSSIMDLGEYFTESWESPQNEPPVPHAESMTIAQLAKTIQQPVDLLLSRLQEQGIKASPEMIVKDIAEAHRLTPAQLYEKMQLQKSEISQPVSSLAGRGYGRKSLAAICNDLNLPLNEALARLMEKGIVAQKETILKDLSAKYNIKPIDIVQIIQGTNANSPD